MRTGFIKPNNTAFSANSLGKLKGMFDHQLKIQPEGREPQDKRDGFILWPYSLEKNTQQSTGDRRGNNA